MSQNSGKNSSTIGTHLFDVPLNVAINQIYLINDNNTTCQVAPTGILSVLLSLNVLMCLILFSFRMEDLAT